MEMDSPIGPFTGQQNALSNARRDSVTHTQTSAISHQRPPHKAQRGRRKYPASPLSFTAGGRQSILQVSQAALPIWVRDSLYFT